jgi:hypothetical protein
MKKLILIATMLITTFAYANANEQSCKDLPGRDKLGKDSVEYFKCLKAKATKDGKLKPLNSDSKLTNIMKGKDKFKIPNPVNGLKKLGKVLKPDVKFKN